METALYYLALSGVLTILLWVPYISGRLFLWGLPAFLTNYPNKNYPIEQPQPTLWMERAQRAHLNMVETMPAFIAVVLAAAFMSQSNPEVAATVGTWAKIFFFARLLHPIVFILGVPFLRTPTYLISWFAILMIATTTLL
ncbi:MAPEG family protein [Candidatus Uabimicrobium sp. HlEnr_7]|uniref:MAPEG family protein n=1 Tax=Candidatus Uabimicrobium helgolandensis TaxID=3095367 RepID=UPI003556318E